MVHVCSEQRAAYLLEPKKLMRPKPFVQSLATQKRVSVPNSWDVGRLCNVVGSHDVAPLLRLGLFQPGGLVCKRLWCLRRSYQRLCSLSGNRQRPPNCRQGRALRRAFSSSWLCAMLRWWGDGGRSSRNVSEHRAAAIKLTIVYQLELRTPSCMGTCCKLQQQLASRKCLMD